MYFRLGNRGEGRLRICDICYSLSNPAVFRLHVWGPVAQNFSEVIETDWFCQVEVDPTGEGFLLTASRA